MSREPELRVFWPDIGDMSPVGGDGDSSVDLAGAAAGESVGRDDELGGVRRDGFGWAPKREYSRRRHRQRRAGCEGADRTAVQAGARRAGVDAGLHGAASKSSSSIRASPISRRRSGHILTQAALQE